MPVNEDPDLKTVLRAKDYAVILTAESLLEGARIRYLAEGAGVQDLFGLGRLVPVNPISGHVDIKVDRQDYPTAKRILARLDKDVL